MHLKRIIEESDTRAGRVFDLCIQFLIVVSLVSFSIETLPSLGGSTKSLLRIIEIFCVAVFTVEYVLRILVADRKFAFIFSFFGIVDLAAILPFYLATGLDLRSLRALRLLRLFRILKLVRYNQAIQRFRQALLIAKEELVLFGCSATVVLYLSAVGIYYFERAEQPEQFSSVFDGMWWAVATLTTVGYGDVYPITVGGKIFTFVVLVVGLGIVAVPTGLIASALSEVRDEEEKTDDDGSV